MAAPDLRRHDTVIDGLRTRYLCAVPPGGAMPVVLLHGLAVSHRYLIPTARALAARHPVYVPDLPGFGHSEAPAGAVLDAAQHAAHLAALLRRVGPGPYCVVGHSYGAEVAAAFAARYPDRAARLVLAGPTSDPAARSQLGQVGRWLRDLPFEQPWQAAVLARDIYDAGPHRVLRTLRHSVHNAIEADLARVRVPVLLLRGRRDPVAPLRWLHEAARASAGPAQVAVVPRAAHNVLTTAGPAVAGLISRFCADGCGPRTGG